jgi:hypothetical protein
LLLLPLLPLLLLLLTTSFAGRDASCWCCSGSGGCCSCTCWLVLGACPLLVVLLVMTLPVRPI